MGLGGVLGEGLQEVAEGREPTEGAMGFLGVVPEQPAHQRLVEPGYVPGVFFTPLDKLLSQSALEAFHVGIALRVARVVVEVHYPQLFHRPPEVILELASVVGLNVTHFEGGNGT